VSLLSTARISNFTFRKVTSKHLLLFTSRTWICYFHPTVTSCWIRRKLGDSRRSILNCYSSIFTRKEGKLWTGCETQTRPKRRTLQEFLITSRINGYNSSSFRMPCVRTSARRPNALRFFVIFLDPYSQIQSVLNPLKPKLVLLIFKQSVRTSKKTQHFTIAKVKRLTLFKEIIAVYCENCNRILTCHLYVFVISSIVFFCISIFDHIIFLQLFPHSLIPTHSMLLA
jgi:hypothetical protein